MKSKWLAWTPAVNTVEKRAATGPTKPAEPGSDGFVGVPPGHFPVALDSSAQPPENRSNDKLESRPEFVHLHLHTDYSLLDGACEIGELTAETARRGMPAVAVTDHGNLFAASTFYHQAVASGVKPIVGCEVYVAPDGHKTRGSGAERSNHLVLLCENEEGYRNLIQLVSAGFLDGFYYKPRVDHELLARHSKGLIALSACLRGEVADALLSEKYEQARTKAYRLRDIFGEGNFFLEIQDQGLEVETRINRDLVALSRETGIPLVATNDCHYLTQSDSHAQEVLMCIQTGKTMSDAQRMKFATDQFYFKTAEEMAQVFHEIPDAVSRTVAIADRCDVKIQRISNPFPEFKVPEGHTTDSYFEKVAREGFALRARQLEQLAKENRLRYPIADYERRLSDEIAMIQKMRFAGYFLIVWDFIRYARAQSVPVGPGRGSAAGSLVSFALQITDVDPLQYDLIFERFLNPERVSMPDIDIDFCMRRRGEVIGYVRQKYGAESVAQIITFGTMAAKAVLKDAGRALDMPYADVAKIAKMIPATLNIELADALKQAPQLDSLRKSDERVKELIEIALRLEGLARHASTHPAGVVISPQPLTEIVPLYKSSKDEITTQYDMNALERIGLLKMDFLGLTTLTVLDDTVRMIKQNRGLDIDLQAVPLDDAPTYTLFSRGDTIGIFQFESHGMRDILKRYQPSRLEDLTALNALYRPGPIQGGMIDDFIARKHGKKKFAYDLPELEEILSETWGVILYQEQVMRIANRLAGFSLGDADLLRRAMSKKKPEEMAAQREKFLTGCEASKVSATKAEKIFNLMAEFAGYGFNKSHSCAYARLAYQTAWLKTHFPVEFMAALLSSEIGDSDRVGTYTRECRHMGISLLPPDVNSSDRTFLPEGGGIRWGLAAIKGIGETAARSVVISRERQGSFSNFWQFCGETETKLLNKCVIESFIKAGALDSLGLTRAQMAAVVGHPVFSKWRRRYPDHDEHTSSNGRIDMTPASLVPQLTVATWTKSEELSNERKVLGIYLSGSPLDSYKAQLATLKTIKTSSLAECAENVQVTLAGVLNEFKVARSRKGNLWANGVLEDFSGSVPLLMFSSAIERFEHILQPGKVLIISGRVKPESSADLAIVVEGVKELEPEGE